MMVNRNGDLNMDQMEANGTMSNVVINSYYAKIEYGWDTPEIHGRIWNHYCMQDKFINQENDHELTIKV